MAPSFLTAVLMIIVSLVPELELEALKTTANTLFILGGAILVAVRQVMNGRSNWLGVRPK